MIEKYTDEMIANDIAAIRRHRVSRDASGHPMSEVHEATKRVGSGTMVSWRLYNRALGKFLLLTYATRREAAAAKVNLTRGGRSQAANLLRQRIIVVPVRADGTSPEATAAYRAYAKILAS